MLNQDDIPLDAKLTELLVHVAKGEQDEAAVILEREPDLLLERGDVTDYSGRTFKNITAFQYAAWAYDSYMCHMIINSLLKLMGEEARPILLQQYEALKRQGIKYEVKGMMYNNQHFFDFSQIKNALQNYLDHYETWDWPEREAYWCQQIGTVQRDLPAHVAQEYCNKKRSPNFNAVKFERTLSFYNYVKGKADTWWCEDDDAEFKLGVDFAIAGGQMGGWGGGGVKRGDWRGNGVGGSAAIDLTMITHLCEVRTADLQKIYEILSPTPEVIEKEPEVAPPKSLVRRIKDSIIRALS